MISKFYEVQIARLVEVESRHTAILTTITAPIIAECKSGAWWEFCKQKQWNIHRAPSPDLWRRTITEVSPVRWDYLCACFIDEKEQSDG